MNRLEVFKIHESEVMMSTNFGVEADSVQVTHVGTPFGVPTHTDIFGLKGSI